MARILCMRYADGLWKKELKQAVNLARQMPGPFDAGKKMCLCHGKTGNAAILAFLGKEKDAELVQNKVNCILGDGIDLRERLDMQECSNYGLMSGMAGIGYNCLCGYDGVLGLLSAGCYMPEVDTLTV